MLLIDIPPPAQKQNTQATIPKTEHLNLNIPTTEYKNQWAKDDKITPWQ